MNLQYVVVFDVIIVFIYVSSRNETGCRRGWAPYGTSCYLISHDQQNWHGSERLCELPGGYLVEIQTADEDAFIQALVDSLQKNVWTGGTDLLKDGTWLWMESMEPMAYSNWEPGEPNSFQNADEHCIDVRPGHSGWNDERCVTLQNYVCEDSEREVEVIG